MASAEGNADGLPKKLIMKLATFDQSAGRILEKVIRKLNDRRAPEILYHYTSEHGFRGVVESGALWLTDIFALNDPSEIRHGINVAVRSLKRAAPAQGSGAAQVADFISFLSEPKNLRETAFYFVGSFSGRGDDLSQWRAYGDRGKGYCLAFDGKGLEAAFCSEGHPDRTHNSSFLVTYDHRKLATELDRIAHLVLDLLRAPGKSVKAGHLLRYRSALRLNFSAEMLTTALLFKHEAYADECEYRFLQIFQADQEPPEVRKCPSDERRYREFSWKDLTPTSLREVMVGPAADQDAERRTEEYLQSQSLASVKVSRSRIPFRA